VLTPFTWARAKPSFAPPLLALSSDSLSAGSARFLASGGSEKCFRSSIGVYGGTPMAKSMKEVLGDHFKCQGEFHRAMRDSHTECHDALGDGDGKHLLKFHADAAKHHAEAAVKCEKACSECEKAETLGDLEKTLLARLAKTTIPDRVRATGTRENPNRAIGRAGDPPPQTQDTEIPEEFVEIFQL
jgi:hypothetical protein